MKRREFLQSLLVGTAAVTFGNAHAPKIVNEDVWELELIGNDGLPTRYGGYRRVKIKKFEKYENKNKELIRFPMCNGQSDLVESVALLVNGKEILRAQLNYPLAICTNIMPQFTPGSLAI